MWKRLHSDVWSCFLSDFMKLFYTIVEMNDHYTTFSINSSSDANIDFNTLPFPCFLIYNLWAAHLEFNLIFPLICGNFVTGINFKCLKCSNILKWPPSWLPVCWKIVWKLFWSGSRFKHPGLVCLDSSHMNHPSGRSDVKPGRLWMFESSASTITFKT